MTLTVLAVKTSGVEMGPATCTLAPTQTSANEAEVTPLSLKVVDVAPTSTVSVALLVGTVKSPAVPAVPHTPGEAEPFTDATVPETCCEGGGTTLTVVAVRTLSLEMAPAARTLAPTQTSANEAEVTPLSLKVVDVAPTSTVSVVLLVGTVKSPAVPAVPQVPGVAEPFTDATVPDTCWEPGGITVTDDAVTTSLEMGPTARTASPTQTSANEGALTPLSLKVVVAAPTSMVSMALLVGTVKSPVVPVVPQVPGAAEPFTDATVPETGWERAGVTITSTAVKASSVATVPMARTLSPTQTLANEGEGTLLSLKVVVVDPTSTV